MSGIVAAPSIAERMAADPKLERAALRGLREGARRRLLRSWWMQARPAQLPPDGDWRVWLILAGRGFGKTRAGAEWVRQQALTTSEARIAIVGATLHEARGVMVEGESGLLRVGRPSLRPVFEPSNRRLIWPGGALGFLYSADDPDSLRGAQHSHVWGDEIAKWAHGPAAWANVEMGLRLGPAPRAVLTTTPRAVGLVRALLADPTVAVSGGRTADNRAHLPASFLAAMEHTYGGTRLGRQELEGELIEDIEGALFTRALIERCRAAHAPVLRRVVVGVDPPAGAGAGHAACGIVVAGLGADARGYVLADMSIQGAQPEGWARRVADAAALHQADLVVAEANNGGAMVESVLRAAEAGLPLKLVHASRGKAARAEPVATSYARGTVRHVGAFPELEDEMCGFVMGGGYAGPGGSPDRADALVWALTELMLGRGARVPGVRAL